MEKPYNITKFGALCFSTENIGDEIQSLAAQRFLPKIDYYIDRDDIDSTKISHNDHVKIILNSWYMSPSVTDNEYHWPPTSTSLDPLLISMHVSFLNKAQKIFNTPQSRKFLIDHSPIGARDLATLNFFRSIGIPSYFSGCLTLTLLPDNKIQKQDFVLAVDVDDEVYKELLRRTSRKIVRMNTIHTTNMSTKTRFNLAKYWLYLYQSSHCVVTSRLHAMLPCLGFNTPVIGITGKDKERYTGLIELVNNYSKNEFIKNKTIDIEHPKSNPSTFRPIRDKLIKTCTDFTDYDSKSSFMYGSTLNELLIDPDLFSAFVNGIENGYLLEQNSNQLSAMKKEHDDKQTKIDRLHAELNSVKKELYEANHPGVKMASKKLIKSCQRYYQRKILKKL